MKYKCQNKRITKLEKIIVKIIYIIYIVYATYNISKLLFNVKYVKQYFNKNIQKMIKMSKGPG